MWKVSFRSGGDTIIPGDDVMNGFMSTRNSLRDAGRAYLLVFGLLFALIISAVSLSSAERRLDRLESGARTSALYECADSLESYASAVRDDDRISAALRFGNAVGRLDCGSELLETLADYAGQLRYGKVDYPDAVTLAAEFFTLAADGGDISERIERFFPSDTETGNGPDIPERFIYAAAKSSAASLLPGVSGLPPLVRGDEGYVMKADNLILRFSGDDGSFSDLFFLRGGDFSGDADDADVTAAALKTASDLGFSGAEVSIEGEVCSLRIVRADGFLFVYDGRGRLIAAGKADEAAY